MSNSKVTMIEKQWKYFFKITQGLSKHCNDADINEGVFRQRSNDRFAIFEADMKSLLGDSTFAVPTLKEKLKLLKDLAGDVTVEVDQDKVVFSDGASSYSIPAPDRSFLDNPYISKPDFDSLLQNFLQGKRPLIKSRIGKRDLKRIRNAASTFHTNACKVVFDNQSASIRVEENARPKDARSSVEIVKDILLLEPTSGYTNLTVGPFDSLDYDGDIDWEMYRDDRVLVSKYCGSIGDVPAATYARSPLVIDHPEPAVQAEATPKGEMVATESESGGD